MLYSLDYYTSILAIVSPRAVTHCLNSSTLLGSKEKKHKTTRTSVLQSRKWRAFTKSHLFKLQKTWNEKTILPEVYKLTSPNPRNKNKAKIHKDSGLLGIEFTVDKTAVSPLINLEMQHDGRSARIG